MLDWLFGRQPESSRTIAVLHFVDGLTLEEVARQTDLSVSGVRKRLREVTPDVDGDRNDDRTREARGSRSDPGAVPPRRTAARRGATGSSGCCARASAAAAARCARPIGRRRSPGSIPPAWLAERIRERVSQGTARRQGRAANGFAAGGFRPRSASRPSCSSSCCLAVAARRAPRVPLRRRPIPATIGSRDCSRRWRSIAAPTAGTETLADGDVARPGDLLRLGYTAAGRAYGVILSIDGRGGGHAPSASGRARARHRSDAVATCSCSTRPTSSTMRRAGSGFISSRATRAFEVAPIVEAARARGGRGRGTPPAALAIPRRARHNPPSRCRKRPDREATHASSARRLAWHCVWRCAGRGARRGRASGRAAAALHARHRRQLRRRRSPAAAVRGLRRRALRARAGRSRRRDAGQRDRPPAAEAQASWSTRSICSARASRGAARRGRRPGAPKWSSTTRATPTRRGCCSATIATPIGRCAIASTRFPPTSASPCSTPARPARSRGSRAARRGRRSSSTNRPTCAATRS